MCVGFSWGCSFEPIVNSPFGTTTSGGQKSQSLNLYPAGDEAEASVSGEGAGSNFAGAGFSGDSGGVIAPGSLLFGSCSIVASGLCFAEMAQVRPARSQADVSQMVPEREPLRSSSAPASEPQARGPVLQRERRVRAPVSPDTRKSLPEVFHSPHSKAGRQLSEAGGRRTNGSNGLVCGPGCGKAGARVSGSGGVGFTGLCSGGRVAAERSP